MSPTTGEQPDDVLTWPWILAAVAVGVVLGTAVVIGNARRLRR